jgi:hypothetical protein
MKTLLLFTLLVFTSFAQAQNVKPTQSASVTLRFAPAPGDYLRITLLETETDSNPPTAVLSRDADPLERLKANSAPRKQTVTAREIGYDWRIEDRDADGNTVITVSYAFIRVTMTLGREVRTSLRQFGSQEVVNPGATFELDTRLEIMMSNPTLEALKKLPSDQQPPGLAEMIANLEWARDTLNRSLVGRPFTMVVSPQGKLLAVRGMDVIMDQYRGEMSKRKTEFAQRAQQDALIESFFGEDTVSKTMTLSLLLPYPAGTVRPGDTWSDKHEFEVSGMKMPVTRNMKLDGLPGADGSVALSGVIEMAFQKDRLVIDARRATLRLRADVDVATGMFRELQSEGNIEITARAQDAAPGAAPVFSLDQQQFSSAVVTRFARRDSSDRKLWVFDGGNGAYRLRLGSDWAQISMSEKIANILFTVYTQAASGAQLTTSVKPRSLEEEEKQPLSEAAARLKALFETDGRRKVKLSWNRLFETGSVRWVRFRLEIAERDGEQQTYWAQFGYGPLGRYSFELTRPGTPSSAMDAEVTGILDSIALTRLVNNH